LRVGSEIRRYLLRPQLVNAKSIRFQRWICCFKSHFDLIPGQGLLPVRPLTCAAPKKQEHPWAPPEQQTLQSFCHDFKNPGVADGEPLRCPSSGKSVG
jgi:hypothetical protein